MNINEIYETIGQNMIDNIPSEWMEAFIDVERGGSDALEISGGFSSSSSKFTSFKFRNFDESIIDNFHHIYKIMTKETDKHKWNRAKFKLTPDNKFNIDFEWDQKLSDEIEQLNS